MRKLILNGTKEEILNLRSKAIEISKELDFSSVTIELMITKKDGSYNLYFTGIEENINNFIKVI